MRAYLDRLAELGAPGFGEQPVEEARRAMEAGAADLFGPVPPVPFEDRDVPGPAGPIPVRVYSPEAEPAPVLVYFHGGGWVLGSIVVVHGVCATLARSSGHVVVSVDYRLAPEHRYPAAVEDAWAVTTWVADHAAEIGGRPGPVAVAGDSAGGNLATIVALRARDSGLPLSLQVLVYPVLDADLETDSYVEFAEGYFLTREGMAWFFDQYLPDGDRFQAEVSPLRAPSLADVAPALVITAECDVLRDEGEAYGRRLGAAGVPVTVSCYDGMIHGFFRLPAVIDRAGDALDEVAAALRSAAAV